MHICISIRKIVPCPLVVHYMIMVKCKYAFDCYVCAYKEMHFKFWSLNDSSRCYFFEAIKLIEASRLIIIKLYIVKVL